MHIFFVGQGKGFDIDLVKLISDAVSIPVIASSGAGAVEHFSQVFTQTNASAALAAGIFHRKEVWFIEDAINLLRLFTFSVFLSFSSKDTPVSI